MRVSEPLWTAGEVAAATGGATVGHWFAEGVAVDSRAVVPGDLFIALAGSVRDGHDHVADALANGAAGAVVAREVTGIAVNDPRLVHVADTQAALAALAERGRSRMQGPVAAITGSAGKTSVKDALRRAVGRDCLAHASERSFNNHVGVPLSLARMPRAARFAVLELGMNAPGEIAPLSRAVHPDVAVVTTVGPAHLGGFESEAAIAEEKAAIFDGMADGGTAVLNIDHAHADLLLARARERGLQVVTVSMEREDADVRPLRLAMHGEVSCMTARVGALTAVVKIGAPGRHWVMNALLVLATVQALNGDVALAGLALSDIRVPAGRGAQRWLHLVRGSVRLIDDAYNANPVSMTAALEILRGCQPEGAGRRIAVLADMEELGEATQHLHEALAPALQAAGVAEMIAVGENMAALAAAAGVPATACADADAALAALTDRLQPGDVVLVKGANRAGLSAVVEGLERAGTTGRAVAAAG